MLHSIYDLTTFCRKTTGDVPAKLVGASTTVVGSKMYLFGGRLVTERRMVSDLYVFDLETFIWERLPNYAEDDIPRARYFHSADSWNGHLVVFGGMSNQPDSINPEELCVLNDVRFYHFASGRWLPPSPPSPEPDPHLPRARYAHLSSVTADRLFIIGGQDFFNTWLDDVCVFDLASKKWVQRRDYPRHCGTYRSVAVCSDTTVRSPQAEMQASFSPSPLGPAGSRFAASTNAPYNDVTPSENLIHLPYSDEPTEDHPSDIYLYSNYNFTDVKRELEVFSPLPDSDFTIQDHSASMTGTTCPPGLRFPTGAILGSHLIIAGTYLAHSYQSFSIWVLDLTTMMWSRIDPGKAIETGSWFRGCLWADANKFLIFGNKHGNLVDDYNRRLLTWDHVAVVDLEAFGIYKPPTPKLDIRMQELGLAAFEERVLTDFEVVCDDGQRIPCARKILEERWPWFKEQRKQFLRKAQTTLEELPPSAMHVPLPEVASEGIVEPRVDPRLTPRAFHLSEPYPVTLALLQYFYSLALITPLQHTSAVLSQLLILASNYRITHLESLVKHAMHRSLSNSTSVGVYEVATLCSSRSLQIRALKTVMSYTQKRPSRRAEKENGGGSAGGSSSRQQQDSHGDVHESGAGGSGSSKYISRPRGTSDAKWRSMTDSGASSSGYNTRGNHESELQDIDESSTNEHTSTPTPTPGQYTSIPTKKQSIDGDIIDGFELRDARGQYVGQHQHSSSQSTAEHEFRHSRAQPSVSRTVGVRGADGQALVSELPVQYPPVGSVSVGSLRARRTRQGPTPISMASIPNYAPPPPPSSASSATDTVSPGSYSETETTDDEYQALSHSDVVSSPSSGWLSQLKSNKRWGSNSAESDGEMTKKRATLPAPPAIAVAQSMPSPALKGSPSTSSFARFLTRPRKKSALEEEMSEAEKAQAVADKAAAAKAKMEAKEKRRAEQEARMLEMMSHAGYNGPQLGSIGVMALYK